VTTRDETKRQFKAWLDQELRRRSWTGPDLHRAIGVDENGKERTSRSQVFRWVRGDLPSAAGAVLIANALDADEREVLLLTGNTAGVSDKSGPIVASDPAEVYIRRIKERHFPKDIEDRLIAEIRSEFAHLDRVIDDRLDTIEAARQATSGPGSEP